jgi:hypothetical protein
MEGAAERTTEGCNRRAIVFALPTEKQVLSARRTLAILCERYSLLYAELAKHSDALGLDFQGIDHDSDRCQKVSPFCGH